MADVRERAVQRDPVADVDVEAVLPVGLVDLLGLRQRKRLSLLAVTYGDTEASQTSHVFISSRDAVNAPRS